MITILCEATDEELRHEVCRRESLRLTEIGKNRYHPRQLVCDMTSRLHTDKVFWVHKAVDISGARFWLDYREYCNAFGGEVWGLNVEIEGELYHKWHVEAFTMDIEVRDWINLLKGST